MIRHTTPGFAVVARRAPTGAVVSASVRQLSVPVPTSSAALPTAGISTHLAVTSAARALASTGAVAAQWLVRPIPTISPTRGGPQGWNVPR